MYDVIIIGAGISGSSLAYKLAGYQLKVLVVEKENDVSCGTTKANSAIIHAGYDPEPGTLMARHNVPGAAMVKEVCAKLDVPYNQCGAMVLAFDEADLNTLKTLYDRGVANGVEGLQLLNRDETLRMESKLSEEVKGCLYAPTSAIVSPWELCLALMETAVRNGVELKLNSEVKAIHKEDGHFVLDTASGQYEGRYVINCAGVYSDKIHEMIGQKEFTIKPSKGEYYLLDKSQGSLVSHTIFQCPNVNGKGVLVSPTVHGNLIVGPDARASKPEDVTTTYEGLNFVRTHAVRSVPTVNFRENIRNFAGVRARSDRGDFIVEESHSVPGFFNVASIMSPGLSSALSIADDVIGWLEKQFKLNKKKEFIDERHKIRFKHLSAEEKNKLIRKEPAYGRVICRCETITEGEILASFDTPIPPVSLDGIKRRCNTGMGRCQGGFCSEKIANILIRKLNLRPEEVLMDKSNSNVLTKRED